MAGHQRLARPVGCSIHPAPRERQAPRGLARGDTRPRDVHARAYERGGVRGGGAGAVKPVLSPQQAVELDRASQARGVAADFLMENAGRAVARAAVDLVGGVYGRRAVVVCGKGNNGGDGLVAARHLARWGMRVAVILMEPADALRDLAAENLERLGGLDVRVR